MTTNSPNPVDGDVQALIEFCESEVKRLQAVINSKNTFATAQLRMKLEIHKTALASMKSEPVAQFADDFIFNLRKQPNGERWPVDTLLYTAPPAQPYASRKQKRIDHSKLAAEIVHNLVSTDSCDEEVTEKLILWVLNRLNKEFPTPPAQLLRPVELPGYTDKHQCMSTACDAAYEYKLSVIEALRQQGYEVKND